MLHRRSSMPRTTAVVLLLGFGLASAGLIGAASTPATAQSPATGDEPRPYVALAGPHSQIDYEAWAVLRDQASFDAMWRRHAGAAVERAGQGWPLTPTIDFETCMVLTVFAGARTNCNGERIVSMARRDDHLLVRYDANTYQTASFDGPDHGDAVTPYGIFVVPRCDLTVVFEENTQGLIGGPARWTKQASITFPHMKSGWFVPGAQQTGAAPE